MNVYLLISDINKNQCHGDVNLLKKFESDVVTAEKLTGGDMNILQTLGEVSGKRRIDYSDLGFGQPKAKKKKDEGAKRGTDIGQAVVYKKSGLKNSGGKMQRVVIEHKVRILEQPKRETIEDSMNASNWFKCYVCGFTCTRINVIVWHNKGHLKKVFDFDTGIKIPGRRRRKPGASKTNKDGKKRGRPPKGKSTVDHSHTNGEVLEMPKDGHDTQQLLQDWEDEEEELPGTSSGAATNGNVALPGGFGHENSDDGYSDDDGYPPPQPDHERRPMPKPADINSAFDALLAATPSAVGNSNSNQVSSKYISNDSDSDCSDWEKYYDKNAESDLEEETVQESDSKSEDGFEKSNGIKHEKDVEEQEENRDELPSAKQEEIKDEFDSVKQESSVEFVEVKSEPTKEVCEAKTLSPVKSEEEEEEERSSKFISSDSGECKSPFEDVDEKEVKLEEEKPVEVVSQKSSADIYEYVDEFGESPQEPYEPPKKPYESLQKYRLLQEAYKSSKTYGKDRLSEDRDSDHLDGDHKEEPRRATEEPFSGHPKGPESPEELPDYESEEEVPTASQKNQAYPQTSETEERDTPDRERGEFEKEEFEEEMYYDDDKTKESDPDQGIFYGKERYGYHHHEGEGRQAESSSVNKPWESSQYPSSGYRHSYDSSPNRVYYQSHSDGDGYDPREDHEEGHYKRSEDTHLTHFSSTDEKKGHGAHDLHKAACSSVQSPGGSSHTPQDAFEDSESSRLSQEAERHGSGSNSPYSVDSVQRKESPHISVPSKESDHDMALREPTRDIEEFMRDTDKLTQNIDMLAKDIDVRSTNSAAIRERVRRSFSDYEEREAMEEEDMPEVLNLSTQDRNIRESSETYSPDGQSSYNKPGASSDKVYHSKSEHSISSSSGNSYMLVPVDAHGNTVSTDSSSSSSLNDGNGNLMAVEATLDDGTTRTLYIDRSQLDPNVDLNNLMLHIDTSGQEHITIPCSSSSETSSQEVFAYEAQRQQLAEVSHSESHVYRHGIPSSSEASSSYRSDSQHYQQISYSGDCDERSQEKEGHL